MSMEETILIQRCQSGDLLAVDALLSRYRNKAYMYALKMTKHSEEASDVVSEAFVRAYKAIGRFRLDSSFPTWLYRIIRNCFLDIRKRKLVNVVTSLDATIEAKDGEVRLQPVDEGETPFEKAAASEYAAVVRSALALLPDKQREMLQLYHQQELTYEEIASRLGAPVGTVKSRLNRARLNFRALVRANDRMCSFLIDD